MKVFTICVLFAFVATSMAGVCRPLCGCLNCGLGSGEDVCNKQRPCAPLVVRPMEVPVPKAAPLLPVSGPCSCAAAFVKPATVPKPVCACPTTTVVNVAAQQQCNLQQQLQQQYVLGGCAGTAAARPVIVDPVVAPNNPANFVPADPISLGLAYKMAQESCQHSEDRLAFGFRQIPKDIPLIVKKKINNVPEGDLYNLNGQIVELKKVGCMQKQSLDEEAAEELINAAEEDEDEIVAEDFKKVSLGEIGYGPAKIKSGVFVNVAAGSSAVAEEVEAPKPCNDGFKPGNVLITQIPQPSPVQLPVPLPEPCASDEEVAIPPVPAFPNGFVSPYTYVSQTASSSCANKLSQSVVLQKLGCN